MFHEPYYCPDYKLDPPEEKHVYETFDDVPESEIDDWIESHREEIIEAFEDDIFEWATKQAIDRLNDPYDYED